MTQRRYLARDEDRIAFYEGMGACGAAGPFESVCTEAFTGHALPHVDAQTREQWGDDWADGIPADAVP